jgi:D-arginine dehydrogenase
MADMTCDVVVVGAGMAGASVAAEIARERSVVVVEAETVAGRHSTGRSAASYLPSYGSGAVRALTVASRALYDEMSEVAGVPLLTPRAYLAIAHDGESVSAVDALLEQYGHLERLSAEQAHGLCPALRPDVVTGGALDQSSMDIDVAALHQAYLSLLTRRGGALHRSAPAGRIRLLPGGSWEVEAGALLIACDRVVDAAGAWADEVAAVAGVRLLGIQPKRRTIFLSPTSRPDSIATWPIVVDACERWYFKPEGGDHVLVSPAEETDCPPSDARPDELAIAQTIDAVNAVTTFGLRSVSHSWAGLRSFVPDRMPVVGSWPEHPGFDFLAGQGGYGIQMGPALAVFAADHVVHGRLTPASADFGVGLEELAPGRLRDTAGRTPPEGGARPEDEAG